MSKNQIKLGAFLHVTGHHVAAWRHHGSQADAGVNFAHYADLARTAERDLFEPNQLANGGERRPALATAE